MRRRSTGLLRASTGIGLAAVGLALVTATPAQASEPTCELNGTTLTIVTDAQYNGLLNAENHVLLSQGNGTVLDCSDQTGADTDTLSQINLQSTNEDSVEDTRALVLIDVGSPFLTAIGSSPTDVSKLVKIVIDQNFGALQLDGSTTGADVHWTAIAGEADAFTLDDDSDIDLQTTGNNLQSILFATGDRNDTLDLSQSIDPVSVYAGAGDDDITLGLGNALVFPGLGADTVSGERTLDGRVELEDDDQPDTVHGPGPDVALRDEPGLAVSYASMTAPVTMSNNGVADDGPAGKHDNLDGVTSMIGGLGNDHIDDLGVLSVDALAGDDTIVDHDDVGSRVVTGGPGHNTLDMSSVTSPVTADLQTSHGSISVASRHYRGDVTNIDKLVGGSGPDDITIACGACTTEPGPGDDTVRLDAQRSSFIADPGSDGADTVTGTEGVRTIADYSARDTGYIGVTLNDYPDDGEQYPVEHDNIGSTVQEVIGGLGAIDDLHGSDNGPDTLIGGNNTDILNGGDGEDVIRGGGLSDAVNGGRGDDTLVGGDGYDSIDGGPGDDRIYGDDDSDNPTGATGNDIIRGSYGNDTIDGGPGDDFFDEEQWRTDGSDVLHGGPGVDRASYIGRMAPVHLSNDGRPDSGWDGENDTIDTDVEYLQGGLFDDVLVGNGGDDILDGGNADDHLYGGGGNDLVRGGKGDDVIGEGAAPNGADDLRGGPGIDTVSYGARATQVLASIDGKADDGAPGEGDSIAGDVQNLTGGAGWDRLTGNQWRNTLIGGAGRDHLNGLSGDDTLISRDHIADYLYGGLGTDRAHRDAADPALSVEHFF